MANSTGFLGQPLRPSSHDDDCTGLETPPGPRFATSLYELCLSQLSRLVESLKLSPQSHHKLSHDDILWKLVAFGDDFENGKLEICIESDTGLRSIIIEILHDIGKALTQDGVVSQLQMSNKVGDILEKDATLSLKSHLEQAKAILGGDDYESETEDCENCEEDDGDQNLIPPSTAQLYPKYLKSLAADVDLLMDLCPTLEEIYRQRTQAHHLRHRAQRQISECSYAQSYIGIIRDKFPQCENSLVERLGVANWLRHKRLRSMKSEATFTTFALSRLPVSLTHPASLFKDSALGSSERTPSTSLSSSFSSSLGKGDDRRSRVPKLPKGADYGEQFVCPFCKAQVSKINTRVDWKIHIFADLQAYVCTFDECPEMLNTYPSRNAWVEHEKIHHLSQKRHQCHVCAEQFDNADSFILHAEDTHNFISHSERIRATVISASTILVQNPADCLKCHLCAQKDFRSYNDYARHVGRHLEEIALRALPPNIDPDDSGDEGDEKGNEEGTGENPNPQKQDDQSLIDDNGTKEALTVPHQLALRMDIGADVNLVKRALEEEQGLLRRTINVIVETPTGPRHLAFTTDLGSDCNLMQRGIVESLGLSFRASPLGEEKLLFTIGGSFHTSGTVSIPVKLRHEDRPIVAQFDVVEDHLLPGIQALLTLELTRDLSNLKGSPCNNFEDA